MLSASVPSISNAAKRTVMLGKRRRSEDVEKPRYRAGSDAYNSVGAAIIYEQSIAPNDGTVAEYHVVYLADLFIRFIGREDWVDRARKDYGRVVEVEERRTERVVLVARDGMIDEKPSLFGLYRRSRKPNLFGVP